MRTKNASLVINPRAGQNIAKITDVLAILAAAGWKTDIAIKEYGGHSSELANEATNAGSNIVVAYGGDGTVNQVVNGVLTSKDHSSVIGVIPGGTANVWAGEVGIPVDPVKAALSLVNSEARKVDVGYVSVESISINPQQTSGTQDSQVTDSVEEKKTTNKKVKASKVSRKAKHHFLLMAGLGIDAAIMGNVSKPLKYRIGALAVGLSAAKELQSYRSFPVEIQVSHGKGDSEPPWKGEAAQVVIGNTRRYGDIAELTPDAYIDDGMLDVCVITGENTLSTLQQVSSLLLRRKPENFSAEYFRGAHLSITVPASVPMQLDGSAVDLKDYVTKEDYKAIQQATSSEQVMITYHIDVLPQALEVAIPTAYDNALFEHPNRGISAIEDSSGNASHKHEGHEKSHVKVRDHHKQDEPPTEQQQKTEEEQTKPEGTQEEQHKEQHKEDALPGVVNSLLSMGRKVTVVGKVPNPEKKSTYIIAGTSVKQSSGETKPVAIVVNEDTIIFNRDGVRLDLNEVRNTQEGMELVVEGKKSKRGVIEASRLVM